MAVRWSLPAHFMVRSMMWRVSSLCQQISKYTYDGVSVTLNAFHQVYVAALAKSRRRCRWRQYRHCTVYRRTGKYSVIMWTIQASSCRRARTQERERESYDDGKHAKCNKYLCFINIFFLCNSLLSTVYMLYLYSILNHTMCMFLYQTGNEHDLLGAFSQWMCRIAIYLQWTHAHTHRYTYVYMHTRAFVHKE